MHSLSDDIFSTLLESILSDQIAAGERLPSERELAKRFSTNRNTLREALQRLEHLALIGIRHGQGITVQDYRKTARFDCIAPFLVHAQRPEERFRMIEDLLRVRSRILEMCVELAASRASEEDIQRIAELIDAQLVHHQDNDRDALMRTEIAMIDAIVDASHSLMARWLANTLLDVYNDFSPHTAEMWVADESFPSYLASLRKAIAEHDAGTAASITRSYYQSIDATIIRVLEELLHSATLEA
ncbi:MAG: GntR family transcriptional regulator [Myxococcota bacterium]|jgi:DNA-binding FadR family transcriptional regulator|nr:GntR family transcriptional regulator [Myxococcota bacterium]